jgi:hypothetical protein
LIVAGAQVRSAVMSSDADIEPPTAVRWEYATHRLSSADLAPRVLNHYGVQGWELVSCVVLPKDDQPLCCVFKRRVT